MRLFVTSVLCAALYTAALVAAAEPAAQRQRTKTPPKTQQTAQGKKKATPAVTPSTSKKDGDLSLSEEIQLAKQVIILYDQKRFDEIERILPKLEIRREITLVVKNSEPTLVELMRTLSSIKASIESQKPLVFNNSGKIIAPSKYEDPYHLTQFLTNRKFPPKKTQFETDAEYKSRLGWYDPCTVYYLPITPYGKSLFPGGRLVGDDDKSFHYDIDKQTLTLFAGDKPGEYQSTGHDAQPPVIDGSVIVSDEMEVLDKRIIEQKLFVLNLTNLTQCPPNLYSQELHQFTFSIKCPPKVAEQLSFRGEIVIGFRFTNLQSLFSHDYLFSTDTPSKIYSTTYNSADASIVRLLLRDRATKKIFFEYHIPTEYPIVNRSMPVVPWGNPNAQFAASGLRL